MDITKQHWDAFKYVDQDRLGYKSTAEIMDITIPEVRALISELRKECPELCTHDRESLRFGQQNMPRDGHKLISFDTLEDMDNGIKQKF